MDPSSISETIGSLKSQNKADDEQPNHPQPSTSDQQTFLTKEQVVSDNKSNRLFSAEII